MSRGWSRGWIVGVMLVSTACMIAPNPEFIGANAASETGPVSETSSETGMVAPCPAGLLDCDDEPGCESDLNDPATCGSCKKSCEIVGEFLECNAGQCEGTLEFMKPDDTFVASDQPDQNFGNEPNLLIDELHTAFIELPGLSALPNNATIESATLHLDCSIMGGKLDIYRVEAPWDELSMTDSNAPTLDGGVLMSFTPQLGDNTVELVDQLAAWQLGSPKHSLALRPAPMDPGVVEFSSSEGAAPPYLVMTLSW